MITEFTGNELDEWRKWRIDQGQMPDSKLDQAEQSFVLSGSLLDKEWSTAISKKQDNNDQ